jgi:hypothetical protein
MVESNNSFQSYQVIFELDSEISQNPVGSDKYGA